MIVNIVEHILILFGLVLAVAVVFRFLHLPVILGYLVVGALLGPHAFAVIKNVSLMENLAAIGVVFLMFTVGLEFSLAKLIALRRSVVLLGGLQVVITIIVCFIIAKFLGVKLWHTALIIGGVITMSSTAIVTKQLSERMEIHSKYGLNAIGILLAQDLAVIPLLIMITSPLGHHITQVLSWSLLKASIAICLILALGHWVMQPLFRITAATRLIELFTLLVLFIALACGWITNSLGMSFALGAFLAGIMLGETKYRNQIEVEIRPFRDVLMGLFFIAIGMLVNFDTWQHTWPWILLIFLAIVIGKSILITLLSVLFGNDLVTSSRCGIILAQGGEFGFALLTLGFESHFLPPDYAQVLLGALILSIAVAPIIIDYNRHIVSWILPKTSIITHNDALEAIGTKAEQLKKHVILCGYGRVGQNIAHMLNQEKITYFALDLDPGRIQNASLAGENISYGDSTHPEILKAAGIEHARALVICFNDVRSATKILENIRNSGQDIPVIVRCKDDLELEKLQALGATRIIAESREESLMMTYHLLLALNMPHLKAGHFIHNVRQKHADLLEQVFPETFPNNHSNVEEAFDILSAKQLRPILIPEQAYAVKLTLGNLALEEQQINVVALRRKHESYEHPKANMQIKANDILVLYGTSEALIQAEQFLLEGLKE